MNKYLWDENNNPIGFSFDQLLYRIRSNDTEGLIFDSVSLPEIIEDSDGVLAVFDALVTPYSRLKRKVEQLQIVMNKAVDGITTVSCQVSEPIKQNGNVHVAAIYELSDGQTVTVVFHNPDATPSKLTASDQMISWKWMLNKKDITIVVAPENGHDLAIREIGRRIMKLGLKNSPAFARMNQKRAERLQNIATLTKECESLENRLGELQNEIKQAHAENEERALALKNTTLSKQFADVLSENGWSLKNNVEDLFKKEYTAYNQSSMIVIDLDEFKNDEISIILNDGSVNEKVTLTANMDMNYKALDTLILRMIGNVQSRKVLESLISSLKLSGHASTAISDTELEVRTARTNHEVSISLNADGTFKVVTALSLGEIVNSTKEPSVIADAIDIADFNLSINDFPDDKNIDSDLIQGGVFKGKTAAFAYAIEQIEKAANSLPDLTIAFGNFNYTAQAGSLFDSVVSESSPPIIGITAQIGYKPTDIILARVQVDEDGTSIIYRGEGGLTKESIVHPASTFEVFKISFKNLIVDLDVIPKFEDSIPELKAYLDQFTPLKRGQVLKSLTRTAYADDGSKVTVAENVIAFAKRAGAKVDKDKDGKPTISTDQYVLSSKLGRIPATFGVWLIESGTIKPKEPENKDLDPTDPKGYAIIQQNNLFKEYQDQLDSFFQTRLIDIRNCLRDMGWDGEQFKDLSKNNETLKIEFKHAGAGGNVVGATYRLSNGYELVDGLNYSPKEVAISIDGAVPEIESNSEGTNTFSFETFQNDVNKHFKRSDRWSIGITGDTLNKELEGLGDKIYLMWNDNGENLPSVNIEWMDRTLKTIEAVNEDPEFFASQLIAEVNHQIGLIYAGRDNSVSHKEVESYIELVKGKLDQYYEASPEAKETLKTDILQTIELFDAMSQRKFDIDQDKIDLSEFVNQVHSKLTSKPVPDNSNNELENTEEDPDLKYLKSVIANPEDHTEDSDLDRLGELIDKAEADKNSDFAKLADQAVTLVQNVFFNQLSEMVTSK